MRTRLLHPISERPNRRRRRGDQTLKSTPQGCDPAVKRVREAGGPVDEACYTCQCGYLFNASVSATVVCPHCGCDQAW